MPIKGLTEPEKRRLPRIGKIHLGIMAETPKGVKYPKATDHFVFPSGEAQGTELTDELIATFGLEPRELRVIFPLEDEERIASQYYRCYSKTRGLICKGDGEKCMRMVDAQSGAMADRDSATVEMKELPCEGRKCPDYQAGKCREMMMLQFMLPEISGLGIWQIDTSSINSIRNINASLDMVRAIYKRVSMVPLILALEQIEVTNPDDGRKKKVWVMALRSTDNMIAAAMKARMEPLQLVVSMGEEITEGEVIETPTPDDEHPGRLVTPDWEGWAGEPISEQDKLTPAQAQEIAKDLWPEDEKARMTTEEAAERMTPAEVADAYKEVSETIAKTYNEAEELGIDVIPDIDIREPLPIGKPGDKLQVIQTGEVIHWHQIDEKGGNWRNTPPEPLPGAQPGVDKVSPTAASAPGVPTTADAPPSGPTTTDAPLSQSSAGELWPSMAFQDLIDFVKGHKKTEGWLFKTFSFNVAKAKEKPYECALEVKQMMNW